MENIVLYSNGCPRCEVLKKTLKDKGISFTEVNDIEKMINLGFKEAPKLEINGNIMSYSEAIEWVNKI